MKKSTVIVHSGSYHADDLFAVAALSLFLSDETAGVKKEAEVKNHSAKKGNAKTKVEIVRTRDENIIKSAEYVVDVGGVYDEANHRFDHHQTGGAGNRKNGIPYAAFGLVWKFCGEKLCGSKAIAENIDERLVAPIDANDNGVELVDLKFPHVSPYLIQNFFYAFQPTWKEDTSLDVIFLDLVEIAKRILIREIKRAADHEEAKVFIEKAYHAAGDKQLIILEHFWPWQEIIMQYKEPLFVVYPKPEGGWCAKTVGEKWHSFTSRKNFPKKWAGKRGKELAEITGVSDAVFCHNALFTACALSKEGAVALAKLALVAE